MSAWWIDRTLPGIVAALIGSALIAAAVWVSHRLLKRHITKVTAGQTAELRSGAGAQKRLLDDYRGPRPRPPEDP